MVSQHPLEQELFDRIGRLGALGFDEWMEAALYDRDWGFFATHGAAGKLDSDFLTSPEAGPLFGAVLARAIAHCWTELGRPDPFTVVEGGAGAGTLAASILAAQPECLPALRYLLVERSDQLSQEQSRSFKKRGLSGSQSPLAERCFQASALPTEPVGAGMVIANELLDNLAFKILERTSDGWQEAVCVLAEEGLRDGSSGDRSSRADSSSTDSSRVGYSRTTPSYAGPPPITPFALGLKPTAKAISEQAHALAPEASPGSRIPWQRQAADWVEQAKAVLSCGQVLVFDYGTTTAELARRDGWLRSYAQHHRGDNPLAEPGLWDITSDVAFDQLPAPSEMITQAEFLKRWGIDQLVDEGNRIWQAQSANPSTKTLVAASRPAEAEMLCDPMIFGNYKVARWDV